MTSRPERPNVLFIMSDQHRSDYTSCAGASFMRTPNLDRIAASGVRFACCATNSPVCAPARIALASGVRPSRLGAFSNRDRLPPGTPTYYQHFRDHGYRVGCIGKLDLNKPDRYDGRHGDRPQVFGWGFTHPEECEGKMHAGSSSTPLGPYGYWLQERGLLQAFHEDYVARRDRGFVIAASHDSVLPTEAFEDAYIGQRATDWLRAVPDDFPWYYFVSFVGPHDPFDPPTEYADRYRHAPMVEPVRDDLSGKPEWFRQYRATRWGPVQEASQDEIAATRRQYCAATSLIDDQIGRLLEVLEERGQLDNTIIVYTSDHGEMLGDHGVYAKSVPYEPALGVPLLVSGPGVAGGRVSDALVELIDANATVTELAGLPSLPGAEAWSLGRILGGETEAHRAEVISTIRQFGLVRTSQYKYIASIHGGRELYDLKQDPFELRNLALDKPNVARALSERLLGFWPGSAK